MNTRLLYTATIALSLVSALALAVPLGVAPADPAPQACAALQAALTPSGASQALLRTAAGMHTLGRGVRLGAAAHAT